jgi:hypothetical protein
LESWKFWNVENFGIFKILEIWNFENSGFLKILGSWKCWNLKKLEFANLKILKR